MALTSIFVTLPGTAAFGGSWLVSISLAMSMQAAVGADRLRLLAHELHAVVVRRVVAGGDHDAAVEALGEGGEVDPFRAAEADVGDVDAGVGQAPDQCLAELFAGEADVAADADALGLQEGGVGLADLVGQGLR